MPSDYVRIHCLFPKSQISVFCFYCLSSLQLLQARKSLQASQGRELSRPQLENLRNEIVEVDNEESSSSQINSAAGVSSSTANAGGHLQEESVDANTAVDQPIEKADSPPADSTTKADETSS